MWLAGEVSVRSRLVRRRLLLTLGAATLIEGCTPAHARWHIPSESELPGDSHPGEPVPTPSTNPSWQVPTPARPTPGVCPTQPGIVQKPGGPQFYLPCSGTNIALTIDDGPDPQWTPQVLALLAQYHITATFCMIGRRAAARPDLVAAVVDGGHQVANHTFTHPIMTHLPAARVRDEISRATAAITNASGGHRPTLFRAPGGAWTPAVLAACRAGGLRPLDWSVDPRDWSLPGVEHIVDVILTRTSPGVIILDHDGGGNRQQTVDALRIALPRLIDAGYRFSQP